MKWYIVRILLLINIIKLVTCIVHIICFLLYPSKSSQSIPVGHILITYNYSHFCEFHYKPFYGFLLKFCCHFFTSYIILSLYRCLRFVPKFKQILNVFLCQALFSSYLCIPVYLIWIIVTLLFLYKYKYILWRRNHLIYSLDINLF